MFCLLSPNGSPLGSYTPEGSLVQEEKKTKEEYTKSGPYVMCFPLCAAASGYIHISTPPEKVHGEKPENERRQEGLTTGWEVNKQERTHQERR